MRFVSMTGLLSVAPPFCSQVARSSPRWHDSCPLARPARRPPPGTASEPPAGSGAQRGEACPKQAVADDESAGEQVMTTTPMIDAGSRDRAALSVDGTLPVDVGHVAVVRV